LYVLGWVEERKLILIDLRVELVIRKEEPLYVDFGVK
jgi:hypothetical protein